LIVLNLGFGFIYLLNPVRNSTTTFANARTATIKAEAPAEAKAEDVNVKLSSCITEKKKIPKDAMNVVRDEIANLL
jgi:hypothetical protein